MRISDCELKPMNRLLGVILAATIPYRTVITRSSHKSSISAVKNSSNSKESFVVLRSLPNREAVIVNFKEAG